MGRGQVAAVRPGGAADFGGALRGGARVPVSAGQEESAGARAGRAAEGAGGAQ